MRILYVILGFFLPALFPYPLMESPTYAPLPTGLYPQSLFHQNTSIFITICANKHLVGIRYVCLSGWINSLLRGHDINCIFCYFFNINYTVSLTKSNDFQYYFFFYHKEPKNFISIFALTESILNSYNKGLQKHIPLVTQSL
jgi:hypothetical protein